MSTDLIPLTELNQMAKALSYNKMFGKTAEELLPLLLIAQAEGKHPAIAAQEYDIIQGRPAINSKSALARFQSAGGCIQWLTRTDTEASASLSHPQGGEFTLTWTWDRAVKAGLTGKDNWKKYPAQMLAARVVAEGVRAVFPACLSGMYTTEEVQDFDPPRKPIDVTPKPTGKPEVAPPKARTAPPVEDAEVISPPAESEPEPTPPATNGNGNGTKATEDQIDKLTVMLAEYCDGDELAMAALLKARSEFKDRNGNEKFLTLKDLNTSASGKWIGGTIGNLTKFIAENPKDDGDWPL